MRIKRLELIGFKSFPNRTVLDIPYGVSGVVGPNGCGKSNVVDAIRWVLGEQSPKHLRGDAMEAVIFNGNERLAPLGMAEVSMTFENDTPRPAATDLDLEVSSIPSHFRDLSEIMVTRRYFRSGDSEYFINKTPCRLKDITELFLGTGVGSRAYAIIEQGRVEQLINAKPEDRRLFIEEAAGTTLYRSRKLAAERKMERTRENLNRVNDVLREIDRQIQYLERQAKKAEAHRRLGEEVRGLELRLAGSQWLALQRQLRELEARRQGLVEEEERLRAAIQSGEETEQAAAAASSAAEQRQAATREGLAVLDAERQSLLERIELLTQEREERERRRARLAEDLEAMDAARRQNEARLREAEGEREASAQYLLFDEGELSGREGELEEARAAVAERQAALEAAKGSLVEHMARDVEARNAAAALERRREDVARQLDRRRAEDEALQGRLRDIEEQAAQRRQDLAALRAELAAAAGEQEARAEEVRTLAETRRRWERRAAELEGVLVQTRSRLESLEQIQRNYEGFHRGVRAIMREEQHAEGVLGVVADVIDIPEQYERAVAAVLGERLQYVIVQGEEQGAGAVDLLRRQASGRGSFIPLNPRPGEVTGAASLNGTSTRLLDLVHFDQSYRGVAEALLGEVVLVPDLVSAVALWKRNGVRVTLVTPEGDVIDPCGVITGGSDRPIEEEILARRREIEALRLREQATAVELAEVRAELERVTARAAEAEAAVKALGEGAHELTLRIVSAEKDVERLDLERPQCASRREVARYEIEALVDEARAADDELGALRARLEDLGAQRRALQEETAARRRDAEEAARRAEGLSAEVTAVKVRVAERRERQQAASARVESARRQQGELAEREAASRADLADAVRERDELERGIESGRVREAEQEQRRVALQSQLEAGAGDLRRLADEASARAREVRELHETLDGVRQQRSEVDLGRSEVRLRAEHLSEAMREKYEADLARSAEAAEPSAFEEGERRLEDLKARLARLGDVNVAAIDELRELEERSGFLRTQRDDLERSLTDLERTIQKLNRASRTRFAETFARANETFQKVFPRLFRGGEARLVLTDEHNLLETGVEIVVRPPGKRLDTVGLLSGGEKALVAVSLIFSLFLINPSPFCILDEVDAPLDDANIARYTQMIREMSAHSQFILITHNKRTMEAADILYGITMQEAGVSKVISVSMS
jgi:chromosome segregation protein